MNDQFYDKKLVPHHKKKQNMKKDLPQIKQPMIYMKRVHQNIFHQLQNSRFNSVYPILSSLLISKKLTPPEPSKLFNLKQRDSSQIMHNFKIKNESLPRKKIDITYHPVTEHKRCNTSLSPRYEYIHKPTQNPQIPQKQPKPKKQIKFLISGTNNNQQLVRSLLLKRSNWRQITLGQEVPNFKWVFYKSKHNYKRMAKYGRKKVINHFQFNQQICTKDSLIKNLQLYCQTKKIQLFTITPVTFVLNFDDQYCEFHLKQFLNFFLKNDPRPEKGQIPLGFISRLQSYLAHQTPDIKKKINYLSKPLSFSSYFSSQGYIWLLKPTGLNRGRGIQLFNTLQQLEQKLMNYFQTMNRRKIKNNYQKIQPKNDKLSTKDCVAPLESILRQDDQEQKEQDLQRSTEGVRQSNVNNDQINYNTESFQLQSCSFVIQKYVERPLLINGRKFDIRVWALLTQNLDLYFFKQGYIRMAAEQYSVNQIQNPFIHLTNNAIQKQSPKYGQFQQGNQLSFNYLCSQLPEQEVKHIWNRIKQISYMTFCSVKKKINQYKRQYCFEIFGLDFMIDFQKRVWLIQVNQNPCIQCSSPLLADLIPKMVDGALKLTVDSIFKSNPSPQSTKDPQKQWELLSRLSANCSYTTNK